MTSKKQERMRMDKIWRKRIGKSGNKKGKKKIHLEKLIHDTTTYAAIETFKLITQLILDA